MSSSNKKSNDDVADISIIRSSDGSKQTFSLPLSTTTLTTLKTKINSDPTLGPISISNQRLFHLGRELKSSNRSLETLGIGRFNVFTVHLHTRIVTKKCLELLESDDDDEGMGEQRKQAAASSANDDDDDDEVHVVNMTTTTATTSNRNRTTTTTTTTSNNRRKHNDNNEVVDLLDDSDSDDDDDVVEIIEPSTSTKRRKRN